MNQNINLKELETRAWKSYFQDGLLDIFIGFILITSALRTFTDNIFFTFFIFVGMFIMILGKRYVTSPRIGLVKFGPQRTKKRIKLLLMIGIAVIITLILVLPIEPIQALPEITASIIVAVVIGLIFGSMAYYLDYYLLALYGVMFAIGELVWGSFDSPAGPMAILVFGIIVLMIGISMLIRFLNKYPIPTKEVPSGS